MTDLVALEHSGAWLVPLFFVLTDGCTFCVDKRHHAARRAWAQGIDRPGRGATINALVL